MDAKAQCTIVADSMAPSGIRLTTALLTYATMVHQDFLTHRTVYKYNTRMGRARQQQEHEQQQGKANKAGTTGSVAHPVCAHTLSETCSYDAFIKGLFDGMAASRSTSTLVEGKVHCYHFSFDADVATRGAQAASQPCVDAVDNDHAGDDSR
jgi:hypothetical protein